MIYRQPSIVIMKKIVLSLAVVSLIAGCGERAAPKSDANKPPRVTVKVDTSSPDNAVKSWWSLMDHKMQAQNDFCEKYEGDHSAELSKFAAQISQGAVLSAIQRPVDCSGQVFRRDIQEVKVESETRAIVFVKVHNITPIPAGAIGDTYDEKWRKDGKAFKYLVEKLNGAWLISQIYMVDDIGDEKWTELYEATPKPYYPSIVFPRGQ